jgi:PAS domain S-box-containing protein
MGSFIDITEQKRIEKALAEEAVRRRILIEQSRDGIVIMDGEGGVFEANQKFAEMLGYTMDEVYRLHVWDWDAKISRDTLLDMIHSVNEEGDHFETQHRRKDGSLIDVEISINAAFFGGKKLIFCVCHDITERRKMEEELRREQTLLRTFINNIPDGAYVKDLQARKLLANPADLENMGLKQEQDALGKTDFELFPHHVAEHFYRDDMYVLRNGKPILNREERLVRPSGEERWLLSSKIPLFDEKGQVIGLVGIGRDITERKNAEERIHYLSFHDSLTGLYNRVYLEEEIKRLDTERQLPIGIIMMDVNGLKLLMMPMVTKWEISF